MDYKSSYRRYSVKKNFLKNFIKFTGKHLFQSLFIFLRILRNLRTTFLQNFSGRLLLGLRYHCKLQKTALSMGIPERWDPRPRTSTGGTSRLGTQNPQISRWDPRPRTLKVGPGTWDPKIFKWNPGLPIFYSFNRLFYTSLVTKLCIYLFIRLIYFMANIQKQPLQCVINFKKS